MVIRSPYPDLDIPEQDVLTYIFGSHEPLSEKPLWINAASPDIHLSLRTGLQWIKRLAVGLDRLGLKSGDVLMMVSPNHIFVPIAYLGAVGSGRIFSGANPVYTADGREDIRRQSCYGYQVQSSCPVVSTIGSYQRIRRLNWYTYCVLLFAVLPYTIVSAYDHAQACFCPLKSLIDAYLP